MDLLVGEGQRLGLYDHQTTDGDQHNSHDEGRCHDAHELQVRDLKFSVQI